MPALHHLSSSSGATRESRPSQPVTASGTEPGQRRLNGAQTSGREYRNLSPGIFGIARTNAVTIPMRDGTLLRADVLLPTTGAPANLDSRDGTVQGADPGLAVPALVSFSCYPRQVQDLGAPLGFIESGASDFFVPRGYAHVIVNARSTGGSEGTFGLGDGVERTDVYDVVEWVGTRSWCDGHVGGMGISYFAISQLGAAVQRPPHLKAIFPFATLDNLYDAVWHGGMLNSGFFSSWLAAVGVTARVPDRIWHSAGADLARRLLAVEPVHERVGRVDGETAAGVLRHVVRAHYDEEPFGRLWQEAVVEHPTHDAWWDEREVRTRLAEIDIPVYLGCQWDNVPMHLPSTFPVWEGLRHNPNVRMTLAAQDVLSWPWESLHVEALAWNDHWLKGRDTGIMDGPPIRYVIPGSPGNEWRTADAWPPPESRPVAYALRADGALGLDEGEPGSRRYLYLPADSGRPRHANPPTLPGQLTWHTEPAAEPLDIVGEIELRLDATITALDTDWVVLLSDVAPDGTATTITAGWQRAQLRLVDEAASRPGRPALAYRTPLAVPVGELVGYRIPLVPNARHLAVGHRLRLTVASSDEQHDGPTVLGFTHTAVGQASLNAVASSSRLLVPTLPASSP